MQISGILGKAYASLNVFLSSFTHHWFVKVLKATEKLCLVQRYRHPHHLRLQPYL